jgi:threonine/homoserine/homoserine lactone efflux protein
MVVSPFENSLRNKVEAFDEIIILAIIYHLHLFTDFIDDKELQYIFGFSVIALTCIHLLINMLIIVVEGFKELIKRIPRIKKLIQRLCKRK